MTEPQMNVPPPPPPYARPYAGTSGLAIASLVLAIVAFMVLPCAPLLSIPAIIAGHIAYSRVTRSGGALGGQGIAMAGFIVGYVSLAIWFVTIPITAAILLPAISRAREAAIRASCQNNLKQIGVMLKMYEGEHNGEAPATLAALYPEYASDLSVFVCPSTKESPGDPSEIDSWSSYEYTPPPAGSEDPSLVVCQEKEPVHIPKGRNVLFADGHVEFSRAP